jgi:hypothetical protein
LGMEEPQTYTRSLPTRVRRLERFGLRVS